MTKDRNCACFACSNRTKKHKCKLVDNMNKRDLMIGHYLAFNLPNSVQHTVWTWSLPFAAEVESWIKIGFHLEVNLNWNWNNYRTCCGIMVPFFGSYFPWWGRTLVFLDKGENGRICMRVIVDRMFGFFDSRPNWDPHPLARRRVCPPVCLGGGGHTRLRERGWEGGPISDEGTFTVVL